jgi:hypothetical protein
MSMTMTHAHAREASAVEERCRMCGDPAAHKVTEDTLMGRRHPFTAYVCCACFDLVMGPLAEQWCRGEWP